ncbi:hypothetical protein [Leptospira wolffii]|uniref:hypothetical protein n=1 Tax=Leptospira wolffii TaxID=409998 RepID=UPI0002F6AAE0|nr:hypothetical protein [Leptospira wolffii]EPG65681.1 hypothetical protein LEP1GSC061_1097 [Leptospira wolffii serovar Khorat str. Khorat-H2]
MKRLRFLPILALVYGFSLLGQDTSQSQSSPKEKMVCDKIDLVIQGTTYNDALRCEAKDAICYMIEGFSMSCFPKEKPITK